MADFLDNPDARYCVEFAYKHEVLFEPNGECGFGRECVGLTSNSNWISHNPYSYEDCSDLEEFRCPIILEHKPEDAYHKHHCMVVLGRGDEAIKQLADWLRALEKKGKVSIVEFKTGAIGMQALISGIDGKTLMVAK